MERLNLNEKYKSIEGAIHINRYLLAKELIKGKKVLDISCGEGYGSYLLAEWGASEVLGVDISSEAIKKAKSNFNLDNVNFKIFDAQNLDKIKDNIFDLIVSFETIEHLDNPELFLKEIKRVGKKDAIFIISCPNDYFYYPSDKESNPYHKRKYTFEEFKSITSSVLETKANYSICTYVGGYINLESNQLDNIIDNDQKRMLDIKSLNSLLIPSDVDISEKGCCYYIGIWNGNIKNSATIYPYVYNDLMTEMNRIIGENGKLQDEIKNIMTEMNRVIDENGKSQDKIKELKVFDLQGKRYKTIMESFEKENEFLKYNIRLMKEANASTSVKKKSIFYRGARKIYRISKKIVKKSISILKSNKVVKDDGKINK